MRHRCRVTAATPRSRFPHARGAYDALRAFQVAQAASSHTVTTSATCNRAYSSAGRRLGRPIRRRELV
ncbi:hypothetical protein [Massilia sp. METH4]|uniref:hypothetical protein n=1 Tax=Massilia sp. METH4 TaxID=3123041 RepID=UPI0030D5B8FA